MKVPRSIYLFFYLLLSNAVVTRAQDFVPISGSVPQDITGVVLPAFCTSNSQVVQTLTTLEPGEKVSVLTYPPDLVTIDAKRTMDFVWMTLTFNQSVATAAKEGGIRIQLPPSQLERVDACCSGQAQILEGFTNVQSLLASTSGSIQAVLSARENTSTSKDLDILASTSGKVVVDYTGGDVNVVSVGTSASIELIANQVTKVDAGTSGTLSLELNKVPVGGSITTSAKVLVSAPGGCDTLEINTEGSCEVQENLTVQVSVGDVFTRSGQETCSISGESTSAPSGAAPSSGLLGLLVGLLGIVTMHV